MRKPNDPLYEVDPHGLLFTCVVLDDLTDDDLLTDPIDTYGNPYSWFMWSQQHRDRWTELHNTDKENNA